MTADEALAEAAIVARSDLRDFVDVNDDILPIHRLPDHAARSVASLKTTKRADGTVIKEVKLWPKMQAVDLIAKHHGLLREKTDVEQHGEVHVHHHYANLDEDDGADTGTG